MLDNAVIIQLPMTIMKSSINESGSRIIEFETSVETPDLEGDVVLQSALLDAAPDFLKNGLIDWEHYSDIGERIGIKDPLSYVLGCPTSVFDMGNKRTGVTAEIMRSKDGIFDPDKNKFDAFWQSLQTTPAIPYRASIFGYPTDFDNCSATQCGHGATRFLIKSLKWTTIAMTRSPMCDGIKGFVKIVKAMQYIDAVNQQRGEPERPLIDSMDALMVEYSQHISVDCPYAGPDMISRDVFAEHFTKCAGYHEGHAEILGNALMMSLLSTV